MTNSSQSHHNERFFLEFWFPSLYKRNELARPLSLFLGMHLGEILHDKGRFLLLRTDSTDSSNKFILRDLCQQHLLSTKGSKQCLIDHLTRFYVLNPEKFESIVPKLNATHQACWAFIKLLHERERARNKAIMDDACAKIRDAGNPFFPTVAQKKDFTDEFLALCNVAIYCRVFPSDDFKYMGVLYSRKHVLHELRSINTKHIEEHFYCKYGKTLLHISSLNTPKIEESLSTNNPSLKMSHSSGRAISINTTNNADKIYSNIFNPINSHKKSIEVSKVTDKQLPSNLMQKDLVSKYSALTELTAELVEATDTMFHKVDRKTVTVKSFLKQFEESLGCQMPKNLKQLVKQRLIRLAKGDFKTSAGNNEAIPEDATDAVGQTVMEGCSDLNSSDHAEDKLANDLKNVKNCPLEKSNKKAKVKHFTDGLQKISLLKRKSEMLAEVSSTIVKLFEDSNRLVAAGAPSSLVEQLRSQAQDLLKNTFAAASKLKLDESSDASISSKDSFVFDL